jgi:hypothetical protein
MVADSDRMSKLSGKSICTSASSTLHCVQALCHLLLLYLQVQTSLWLQDKSSWYHDFNTIAYPTSDMCALSFPSGCSRKQSWRNQDIILLFVWKIEGNNGYPRLQQSMFRPRFEMDNTRVQVRSVAANPTRLVFNFMTVHHYIWCSTVISLTQLRKMNSILSSSSSCFN